MRALDAAKKSYALDSDKLHLVLADIKIKIGQASEKGEWKVLYDGFGFSYTSVLKGPLFESVSRHFENLGYKVSVITYCTRPGNRYYVAISWEHLREEVEIKPEVPLKR